MTSNTTPAALDAARAVIAAHEAQQLAEQEAAERARQAEQARQDARRLDWARAYASGGAANERTAALAAERQARADAYHTLADAPWVQALARWQAATHERRATFARESEARVLLRLDSGPTTVYPQTLVEMMDGKLTAPQVLRMLAEVLDDLAPWQPLASVEAHITAANDHDD